ncbi:hypothetical protein GCM10011341_03890 [Frigidibacter albus]|nr:ATP-binding cassette domain-containing protein [Frigidibacter albus]GGH44525.1 hypothetical protein GCM10011341_03890 [Frigidibacter albus]
MTAPALSVTGLHKSFGANAVLRGIDLQAQDGEVISLIGASGSGNSTFLRCIPMLEVPDSGRVAVGEQVIEPQNGILSRRDKVTARTIRSELGFVFQSFNLWPHRTVLEKVIEAPIHLQGRPPRPAVRRADKRAGP